MPRIEKHVTKHFSRLPKKMQRMVQRFKEDLQYDPDAMIRDYPRIRISSNLGQFMSLRTAEDLLNANLNEGRFFTLLSIILYALSLDAGQKKRGL